ncbi:hypothetical protein OHB54_46475 (plasmid) [Streptomyces sp. NBC_01007]|nr:hypothetical protein OHB54_46475 [Streptomyces sp. NBC_01007]
MNDDDVTFEDLCAGYEAMDQEEYAQFMAQLDDGDAYQSSS